jgi:pimeloyl-ACP methyl ester carboxylesterase
MPSSSRQRQPPPPASAPDLVDPAFLLKGFGFVFLLALVLAYTTLCVVYSHSQWQLALHPSRTLATTPADFGLRADEVHFGVDASGEPQLDGWWIASGPLATRTVLVLHSATGNMADALGTAAMFHELGLNVLLFDYRGYGRSGSDHPTQAILNADAASALSYLSDTRKLSPSSILIYGRDLGASTALHLCAIPGTTCPAMILDAPDGDLLTRASQDIRSRAVPTSILFHERFPLAAPLAASTTPKLLVLHSNNQPPQIFCDAGNPKMILSVRAGDDTSLRAGIQRFLDSY